MDKKLNRQIGYKPNKTIPVVKPSKQKTITIVSSKVNKGTFIGPKELADLSICEKPSTAKDIITWIKAHPFFKWTSMCIEIGIDPGNFKRTMESESPVLKPDNILKIEKVLKNYGYKS